MESPVAPRTPAPLQPAIDLASRNGFDYKGPALSHSSSFCGDKQVMARRAWAPMVLVLLAACRTSAGEEAAGVDFDTIRVHLQTADPGEEAYIKYVVTLAEQNRLPSKLLHGAFQWARRKSLSHKRFQYFKYALITLAGKIGIALPRGTPDLTPDVTGKVSMWLLLVKVPCAGATVTIEGTKRSTVTDQQGEFRFGNVPLGSYTIRAEKRVGLLTFSGSSELILPTDPPSDEPAVVEIVVR